MVRALRAVGWLAGLMLICGVACILGLIAVYEFMIHWK